MEQVVDWLNENELRAYPILEGYNDVILNVNGTNWQIPNNLLLDLKLTVKTFSLNHPTNATVYLKKISYSAENGVNLLFGKYDGEDIEDFNIPNTQTIYPYYLRTQDGNLIVAGKGILDFIAVCSGTPTEIHTNFPIEPSTYVEFRDAWLGVTNLYTTPQKENDTLISSSPKLPLEESITTYVTGKVKFIEGYNFRIDIKDSLIDMEVGANYGLTMDCATHFIASQYLDCGSIVSYINGIPPDDDGNFRILQGANIVLTSGKTMENFNDSFSENSNQNTVFVSLSFQQTDLCAPVPPSIL